MSAPRCSDCKGQGEKRSTDRYGHQSSWRCYTCDGTGRLYKWSNPGHVSSHLSTSDINPDTVGESNIRVWRELHADSENTLWRYRTGGYGSRWIELRHEIVMALEDLSRPLLRRAERLGLTGLVGVIESLQALEKYPILDEDDYSKVEREEETEHWENYGRSELESALRDLDENLDDNWEACLEATGEKDLDSLYWSVCREKGSYPEKIDSSAYDFGVTQRQYPYDAKLPGWATLGCYERLVPDSMRGLSVEQFSVVLDARLEGKDKGFAGACLDDMSTENTNPSLEE